MELESTILNFLNEYPNLSNAEIARRILDKHKDLKFKHRTLRRKIAKTRKELLAIEEKVESIDKKYYYDKQEDLYIFYFRRYDRPIYFSGEVIRSLKSKYSNWDGNPYTINEICRSFQISRMLFKEIKSSLEWTHDSEPFTDEELSSRPESEMVEDFLQTIKFSLHQRVEREKLAQLKKDASNWNTFLLGTFNPFIEKIREFYSGYRVPRFKPNKSKEKCIAVVSPYDLHYGKYCTEEETGTEYNRIIAEELLLNKTEKVLQDLIKYNITKVVVAVGSDYFHVDNFNATTTKGTVQDVDGSPLEILYHGSYLMIRFIDLLRQVADVEILTASGNHDRILSYSLMLFLRAWYKDSEDVVVKESLKLRQYLHFGNTLIGFCHADEITKNDLAVKIVDEGPKEADVDMRVIKYKAWFVGHLHKEAVIDVKGCKFYQMPSLSGFDRWHYKKGFNEGNRSMSAYVISETGGITNNIFANL